LAQVLFSISAIPFYATLRAIQLNKVGYNTCLFFVIRASDFSYFYKGKRDRSLFIGAFAFAAVKKYNPLNL
jgi:hypothetical protein